MGYKIKSLLLHIIQRQTTGISTKLREITI